MSRINFRARKIDINKQLQIFFDNPEVEKQADEDFRTQLSIVEEAGILDEEENMEMAPSYVSGAMRFSSSGSILFKKTSGSMSNDLPRGIVLDIPTPTIKEKKPEEVIQPRTGEPFRLPFHYVKYWDKSFDDDHNHVYYDMDDDDFSWFDDNFGSQSAHQEGAKGLLTELEFETLVDRFEKIQGTREFLITFQDVEAYIKHYTTRYKNPELLKWLQIIIQMQEEKPQPLRQVFDYWRKKRLRRRPEKMYKPPFRPRAVHPAAANGSNHAGSHDAYLNGDDKNGLNDKLKKQIKENYYYCGKPLLEQFELPPDMQDMDPYLAFRPREKDKTVARKNRFSNEESLNRMQQLKKELEKIRSVQALIVEREKKKRDFFTLAKPIVAQMLDSEITRRAKMVHERGSLIKKHRPANRKNRLEEMEEDREEEEERPTIRHYKGAQRRKRKHLIGSSDEEEVKPVQTPATPTTTSLSTLTKALEKTNKPLFAFLLKLRPKEEFYQVANVSDEDDKTVLRRSTCRFGRGGRILFDTPRRKKQRTSYSSDAESQADTTSSSESEHEEYSSHYDHDDVLETPT